MMWESASLFGGFRFPERGFGAQQTDDVNFDPRGSEDVQRFAVKNGFREVFMLA